MSTQNKLQKTIPPIPRSFWVTNVQVLPYLVLIIKDDIYATMPRYYTKPAKKETQNENLTFLTTKVIN